MIIKHTLLFASRAYILQLSSVNYSWCWTLISKYDRWRIVFVHHWRNSVAQLLLKTCALMKNYYCAITIEELLFRPKVCTRKLPLENIQDKYCRAYCPCSKEIYREITIHVLPKNWCKNLNSESSKKIHMQNYRWRVMYHHWETNIILHIAHLIPKNYGKEIYYKIPW
jgi:hypothetical protein